jgi:Icc-related predicted phosphoesterase
VKILCVSDTIMPQMESASNLRRRYSDVELVVSCGDLSAAYLEYIISVLNVPLFYVRGNHDEGYKDTPPGGENLHQRIIEYNGLTFVGLEGSIKYNRGDIQYTEPEMFGMVVRLCPQLLISKTLNRSGIDVFVAHSPAWGIHDAEDRPHRGFKAFLNLIKWYHPRYMVHGHVHTYDRRSVTRTEYEGTTILNVNPVTVIDIEPVA